MILLLQLFVTIDCCSTGFTYSHSRNGTFFFPIWTVAFEFELFVSTILFRFVPFAICFYFGQVLRLMPHHRLATFPQLEIAMSAAVSLKTNKRNINTANLCHFAVFFPAVSLYPGRCIKVSLLREMPSFRTLAFLCVYLKKHCLWQKPWQKLCNAISHLMRFSN